MGLYIPLENLLDMGHPRLAALGTPEVLKATWDSTPRGTGLGQEVLPRRGSTSVLTRTCKQMQIAGVLGVPRTTPPGSLVHKEDPSTSLSP